MFKAIANFFNHWVINPVKAAYKSVVSFFSSKKTEAVTLEPKDDDTETVAVKETVVAEVPTKVLATEVPPVNPISTGKCSDYVADSSLCNVADIIRIEQGKGCTAVYLLCLLARANYEPCEEAKELIGEIDQAFNDEPRKPDALLPLYADRDIVKRINETVLSIEGDVELTAKQYEDALRKSKIIK